MNTGNAVFKIYNGKIITINGILENGTGLIKNGKIEAVFDDNTKWPEATEINANGQYIAPEFVDIQINGYLGVDFANQQLTLADIRKATKVLWQVGVTTYLPTVITNGQEGLLRSFAILTMPSTIQRLEPQFPDFIWKGPIFLLNRDIVALILKNISGYPIGINSLNCKKLQMTG